MLRLSFFWISVMPNKQNIKLLIPRIIKFNPQKISSMISSVKSCFLVKKPMMNESSISVARENSIHPNIGCKLINEVIVANNESVFSKIGVRCCSFKISFM